MHAPDHREHCRGSGTLVLGYLPAVNLGEIAQQELGRVARATGQSSSLVTLDGAGIVFIARVPRQHQQRRSAARQVAPGPSAELGHDRPGGQRTHPVRGRAHP